MGKKNVDSCSSWPGCFQRPISIVLRRSFCGASYQKCTFRLASGVKAIARCLDIVFSLAARLHSYYWCHIHLIATGITPRSAWILVAGQIYPHHFSAAPLVFRLFLSAAETVANISDHLPGAFQIVVLEQKQLFTDFHSPCASQWATRLPWARRWPSFLRRLLWVSRLTPRGG